MFGNTKHKFIDSILSVCIETKLLIVTIKCTNMSKQFLNIIYIYT